MHGVFGFAGALEAATSSRNKGVALNKHLSKRPRQPAEELTDLQVYALEAFLQERANEPELRIAAGTLLLMIYCRCRASDTYRFSSIQVDRSGINPKVGFIEATALAVKNAKSLSLKLQLLPVVGPISGLGADCVGCWWDAYSNARIAGGLAPLEGSQSPIVLWPKTTTSGAIAHSIHSTPDDLSASLRIILAKYGFDGLDRISSHSCKATLLSFCAKRGTMQEPERKILGYHLEHGTATVKAYSRDNMAAPLRKLNTILKEVAAGFFLPSSGRAGRFPADEDQKQIHISARFSEHLKDILPSIPSVPGELDEEDIFDGTSCSLTPFGMGDEIGMLEGSQLNMSNLLKASTGEDESETQQDDHHPLQGMRWSYDGQECPEEESPEEQDQIVESCQTTSANASGDASESSSSSSSDESSQAFEDLAAAISVTSAPHQEVGNLWKVRGGCYHLGSEKSDLHLRCGTKISATTSRIIHTPRFLAPKCKRCFGTK